MKKSLLFFIFIILLASIVYADPIATANSTISTTIGPYCGDASCNNGETCSSCSSDCGACPSSGGGGGSSHSSPKQCNDKKDNDGDGRCDFIGCTINSKRLLPDLDCDSFYDDNEQTTDCFLVEDCITNQSLYGCTFTNNTYCCRFSKTCKDATPEPVKEPEPVVTEPELKCGDAICTSAVNEDCTSCPQDCGACPVVEPAPVVEETPVVNETTEEIKTTSTSAFWQILAGLAFILFLFALIILYKRRKDKKKEPKAASLAPIVVVEEKPMPEPMPVVVEAPKPIIIDEPSDPEIDDFKRRFAEINGEFGESITHSVRDLQNAYELRKQVYKYASGLLEASSVLKSVKGDEILEDINSNSGKG